MTNEVFFQKLLEVLGGVNGMGFSLLGLVVVKWLALAFEWKLGDYVGVWKLSIISALTVLSVVLANVSQGIPLSGACCNGAVFAALSVFINNFYKQWQKRHEDRAVKQANEKVLGKIR